MNNKLSKFLALTVAVGAFAFAGCGGDSSDDGPSATEAQKQYATLDSQMNDFGKELGTTIGAASGKTDVQLNSEFESLANRATAQVDDLKKIEVPDDVTAAKDDLVQAYEDGINDLQQIASAAGQHDADGAGTATRQLITDSQDITKAKDQLKAALKKAAN